MSAALADRDARTDVARNAFEQAANEGKSAGQRFLARLDADSLPDALFAKVAIYYDPADEDDDPADEHYDPADEDHLQPRLRAFLRPVQIALVERGAK